MKVLLVGESWMKHIIHVKGFDSFTTSEYEEGAHWFRRAMKESNIDLTYIRAHEIDERFPNEIDSLKQFDVVLFSDIGSNSFLLPSQTFNQSQKMPNRLQLVKDYVLDGGAFAMIGGYLSFQGIDAKAKFKGTPIEDILPVQLETGDDREEVPEGQIPLLQKEHEILKGISAEWPAFLGYNRMRVKDDAEFIMSIGPNNHPFLVTGEFGKGRTLASPVILLPIGST
ncbi:glutamine amidotransferase [Thalassobacillus sp. C254]|uniref:glutamine amidotransferase n=1 Tax=Thalassobacillus sp. C254 TaxID=1225341 RepID=UPI000A8D1FB3|nr:glutamine amidotransferase [Thalassobacillus sp. C254]